MIGLVLVSHSAALADGVRALIEQMTQGRVPIAVAGGVDDPDNPIGTDVMKVAEAISAVYSPDGVVVLMDLGSALLSAETALEFLDPDWLPNVHLSDAPFVEGALSAAVQASTGSPIDHVLAAARGGLAAKQGHLNTTEVESPPPASPVLVSEPSTLTLTVPNRLGLHARPAARLVTLVGQHAAQVVIRKGDRSADGRQINAVALLDARQGDSLTITATGVDAQAVLNAIHQLAADNFGDRDDPTDSRPTVPHAVPAEVWVGISAAPGIAVGQILLLDDVHPQIPAGTSTDPASEQTRFADAIHSALVELDVLSRHADAGAIFEAQALMLRDDEVLSAVQSAITERACSAECAWWGAIEMLAERYRASGSELLRGRAADVFDVGRRVLRQLAPETTAAITVPEGSILAAPDLSPSEAAHLDRAAVRGIVTQAGGATSHMAIIARGQSIPAVVGLGPAYSMLMTGQTVIIDGDRGWLYPRPTPEQIIAAQWAGEQRRSEREQQQAAGQGLAFTPDGRRVEVSANIGSAADAQIAAAAGAESVGVFRTELLFMSHARPPTEDEQFRAYTAAAEQLHGQAVIIRTLDVGGDKPIAYLNLPREANPFLGYRGVRCWLDRPELAVTQLRAICRASAQHPIKVMFPMIGTLEEVQAACQLVRDVQAQLSDEDIDYDPNMQMGIMIEVPSAALLAQVLAAHVDFLSVGTNDLTQYLLAADRGNGYVNALVSPFQPALLRALQQVVEAAHAHGKWAGVCGEMAGDPRLTRLLIGLGVDELSMNAPAIPAIKTLIRQTNYADAQAVAAHALTLSTAAQVEAYLTQKES
ncbi:MAG: phosphoenolpyruvate--protein phosphotransferase [Chloroflexi bacterium]|nr:phosphoenolpyruvate--protein phosphotransferase [Chloroflexota bacterium]